MAGDIQSRNTVLQISTSFTEETLISILKKASGTENVQLVHYEVAGGSTRAGDSYLSALSRLRVDGMANDKPYSLALIVKSLPASTGCRKTFRSAEFFQNEAAFYNEVLPRFMAFQNQKKPKNPFQEIPRCLYALADGENDFIVLEDLSPAGYVTADRTKGLDFDHCVAVLQTLGRFHALSFAMKDQDPEGFETVANCVKETYFSYEHKGWYEGQLKRLCRVAIDAVSKEYPNSIYEEKLKHFIDASLFECLVEFCQPKEPYAVIGHGDTWIPNFLFHYDDHKGGSTASPDRTRMIDFQLVRYGSPILDFSLFLFSCTTQELRSSHFRQLLQVYHHSLSDFLQELGSSPDILFSYNAFEKELSLYMLFGLCLSFDTVTFSVMDEEETPNLDLIEGDEAIPLEKIMHVGPIKSKHGRLRLADNVKFAVDSKYL